MTQRAAEPVIDGSLVAERFEAKYLVARADSDALCAQLAARLVTHHHSVPPGFRLGAEQRHITTTTYFDTARRDLYRAAVSSPVHLKVRARQYRDELHGARETISPVFLELKERDGESSRKRRVALAPHDADRLFAALALADARAAQLTCEAFATASGEPTRSALLRDLAQTRSALGAPLRPSCTVRYWRQAFQDDRGTLRVTLDRDVQVFRAPPRAFDAELGAPVFEEPACVLEAKSRSALPGWLADLFEQHGARAAEYSKLVMASRAVHGAL
jgi:hypothetical protein